jgi:hypothetical protein
MMSKLHLHVKSLTMFVHVVTTMTWMTKNDISNGSDFNPYGELTFMHFENDENQ